jgi:uncharacterized repeat protein (TIGR03803 family)
LNLSSVCSLENTLFDNEDFSMPNKTDRTATLLGVAVNFGRVISRICVVQAVVLFGVAQCQTFSVLHAFAAKGSSDGKSPEAGLVRDSAGNFYGTTSQGGNFKCFGAAGCGVVYKLNSAGVETILHRFTGPDGATPLAPVILDRNGNIYGTTTYGGNLGNCLSGLACGTVYKLSPSGKLSVLHSFGGGSDGSEPTSGLLRDNSGNLYGTTAFGGASGFGTIFKIDIHNNETVLYSFTGGSDSLYPTSLSLRDSTGNLYGTTEGSGQTGLPEGTLFKLDTAGNLTNLYTFTGGADGAYPQGVIVDTSGNFYGNCLRGGAFSLGVVFKIDANGNETVLHTFSGDDGSQPKGTLVRDTAGDLFGVAFTGGANGSGLVFELDTSNVETVLYTFTDTTDGGNPVGSLLRDSSGNLFGTTSTAVKGAGTVYELVP